MTEFLNWLTDYLGFAAELLIACLLYILPLKKRDCFPLRLAAGVLLCLAMASLIPRVLLRYVLEFAGVVLLARLCCAVSLWDALYCGVCAYATQHFAFCAYVSVLHWADIPFPDGLCKVVCYLLVYGAFYFCFARALPEEGCYNTGARQSLAALLLTQTCTILLSYYITSRITAGTADPDLYVGFLYAMLCCLSSLWLQVILQKQSRLQREMALKERLWHQQKVQYDLAKENIALINQKCHDMKHQIDALARQGTGGSYWESLESAIQIYDCTVKTGNEALDTVLTEKKLYCEAHRINMTCVADGSKLSFMDPVDLYALLGNAIDNAIEAVEGLEDPEQRLIAVSVWASRGLLLLQFENYFDHPLVMDGADGLPATTKGDDGYHGFGIRSIRDTAEKYGGCMTVHGEEGLFILRVSFPL